MQLDDYLKGYGCITTFAKKLGVSSQLLYSWRKGIIKVPQKRCLKIEEVTEGHVTAEELRPDLNWAYLREHQMD